MASSAPEERDSAIFKSSNGPAREKGRETRKLLRDAAIVLFAQHGYQNVSLRMLAQHIGIQAGSIYNHINNKQLFLFLLLRSIMEELEEETLAEIKEDSTAGQQLDAFVRAHVEFHAGRKEEVFIGNMELRNLEQPHLEEILEMRRRYENRFVALVKAAVAEDGVELSDVPVVARALMGMLNGVANWYSDKGPLKVSDIAILYIDLVRKALGLS